MPWTRLNNTCATCGRKLAPYSDGTFTAHEFSCYKANPDKIPERDKAKYAETLAWSIRSANAKRGAATRRRNRRKG